MEVFKQDCYSCGQKFEVNNESHRRNTCFRCHVRTISLGFRYGKENFHGPTIKEKQDKIKSDALKNGVNAVPASEYGF